MAYETRELTGSLFPNTRKTQPNHADHQGTVKIDGKEYWISGWNKDKGYISLAFKLKPAAQPATQATGVEDDDIPF